VPHLNVGLVGLGAIGQQVAQAISSGAAGNASLAAVLVKHNQRRETTAPVFNDLAAFLATRPTVVVEAAGPVALSSYAEPILSTGAVLITASAAAFVDPKLRTRLAAVCRRHATRVYLPAGALGGLDALAAAAVGGLDQVTLRIIEPGESDSLIFGGEALDGARQFPSRLNVAMAASLAAASPINVELRQQSADPSRLIELSASGGFGDMRVQINLRPQAGRISHIVALSLLSALRRLTQPIRVG
jgi:aspartate dehydrogenase